MREQLKALIAGWKSRASEQQTVRAITLRGCADDLQALLVADVGGWRPATPTPGAAAMTEHTLAEMIERRSETCDIAERAWRGDPTNDEIWESMNLAKCRLADVVQGNLPAILTALRRPEPGPRPEADEGAVPSPSEYRSLLDACWAVNDKLRITPGMEAIFTGSTNDIDAFRDLLHELEPAYRSAAAQERQS